MATTPDITVSARHPKNHPSAPEMDCSRKLYHTHGFDSKRFLQTYFSGEPEMTFAKDILKFPAEKIFNTVSSELKKGGTLIDISIGPMFPYLFSLGGFFKEITLLRFSETCIMELRKWLDDHSEAFDWSHMSSVMADLHGRSVVWKEEELQLKSAIKQIVKCDLSKKNLTDPLVLPPADCVMTAWILDVTSTNREEFTATLKKFLALVKPGGLLLMIGTINGTYYEVGEDVMNLFQHDEKYVKNAVTKEGFTVTQCEVFDRTAESNLTDYQGISFLAARKNK